MCINVYGYMVYGESSWFLILTFKWYVLLTFKMLNCNFALCVLILDFVLLPSH